MDRACPAQPTPFFQSNMQDKILEFLGEAAYVPATRNEIQRQLRLPRARANELNETLKELEATGRVARIKGDRYIRPKEADLIPGRIRIHRQGTGFLLPDDPALKEIRIPEHATHTALHEDHVLVRRNVKSQAPGRRRFEEPDTGTVIRILQRHRTRIVGTLKKGSLFLYVVPDDPRFRHDFYVKEPKDLGRPARPGDKVVVELRVWESPHTNPEGEIVEVLGPPDAEGVDMLSVIRHYGLPLSFPKAVLDEANALGTEVHAGDRRGRLDCRKHGVVTIDPEDAKDFDDAISVSKNKDGTWQLWVHVADVAHYVKPGSALDEEARRRGNSTYLVDRVVPMLPETLSNELCSLKPHVDRLTNCVEFKISREGRVLQSRFHAAVIHSKRRYSYPEALGILQRKPTSPNEQALHDAHQVAQILRRNRFQEGSLDLDFPETKIRLDPDGRVDRIERNENDIAHQLIEEFMLLANEAVARELLRRKTPCLHRVHEAPDPRRLKEYQEEVRSHEVPCGNLQNRAEVTRLLKRLGRIPIGTALKIGFLKSLMRARYAALSLGHYGLNKKQYTHFTSPIRRYADLIVHRSLFQPRTVRGKSLKETADHLSDTERNSSDAERDSKDVKLHAFLEAQLASGNPITYKALIVDLRNFGFFVDVPELAMSGLVPLSSIGNEFFVYDRNRNVLTGRRTRKTFRIGDAIQVRVGKVDRIARRVDFRWISADTRIQPDNPPTGRRVRPKQERYTRGKQPRKG